MSSTWVYGYIVGGLMALLLTPSIGRWSGVYVVLGGILVLVAQKVFG